MASLALKAIAYGAEKIPDRVFESIPGGYFTPQEKDIKKQRKKNRSGKERGRDGGRRRSSRPHNPPINEFSDDSVSAESDDYDDRRHRRRSKRRSLSRSISRSLSRSRDKRQAKQDVKAREREEKMMGRAEHGEQEFPPPPGEYVPPRPYNPADYAPTATAAAVNGAAVANEYYDRQPSSTGHEHQYPAQVNCPPHSAHFQSKSPFNSTSYPSPSKSPFNSIPYSPQSKSPLHSIPYLPQSKSPYNSISYPACNASPLEISLYPSFEPPFAAWLHQSKSNTHQPYAPSPTIRPATANSSSAIRYTPAVYSPPNSATFAPSPSNVGYVPYNPADYAVLSNAGHASPHATFASPPSFYRQPSHSQPSLNQHPLQYPPNNQLPIDGPSRRSSTKSSHQHKHRSGGGSSSHRTRFDQLNLDAEDKKVAAGAAGAAIGGLGGGVLERRHEKKKESRGVTSGSGGSNRQSQDLGRDRERSRREGSRHPHENRNRK
ncbi:hypothetical protein K432DRAFT_435850, partial [Lepidopterella palustris CBS 459.81]